MGGSVNIQKLSYRPAPAMALFDGLSLVFGEPSRACMVAIMGPSGVGKTTLCDLLLGLRKPSAGSVAITPQDARIAFVPQRAVLFEELSIRENIECLKHSRTVGASFSSERAAIAIEKLGLRNLVERDAPVRSLSLGEAQRVMLARTQAVDADVIILDEPCSFLDNRSKSEFLHILRDLVDSDSLLAIYVTHDWSEAGEVADEIVMMRRLPQEPAEVWHMPVESFRREPPTLDAFYTIAWPRCVVVQAASPPALMQAGFPEGAFTLGFTLSGLCGKALASMPDDQRRIVCQVLETAESRDSDLLDAANNGTGALCLFDETGHAVSWRDVCAEESRDGM